MLTAVKGNRETRINEDQKDEFLKEGYDIIDEKGVRTVAPSKTVPYAEHSKVLEENKTLLAKVEKLEKDADSKVVETINALKEENGKLKEENKALTKELEALKKAGK